MVRERSHRTFNESLGVVTSTRGRMDKVGHRSKRTEKADDQGQLPPHEHTGDPTSLQSATVFLSLDACGAYHAVRIKPGSRV